MQFNQVLFQLKCCKVIRKKKKKVIRVEEYTGLFPGMACCVYTEDGDLND